MHEFLTILIVWLGFTITSILGTVISDTTGLLDIQLAETSYLSK